MQTCKHQINNNIHNFCNYDSLSISVAMTLSISVSLIGTFIKYLIFKITNKKQSSQQGKT